MFFLVTSHHLADHVNPPGHPERVARAHVIDAVAAKWQGSGVSVLAPRPAARDEITRIHASEYVDRIEKTSGRAVMLDPDTVTSPDTASTATLAAGAAIVAVDAVVENRRSEELSPPARSRLGTLRPQTPAARSREPEAREASDRLASALVMVRPPGHHAEVSRAMGFCIYNNIAIAAAGALARGVGRVAIVDYDVHHGNGTQWSFYDDPRVLFISLHEFPFYPGTGAAGETGVGRGDGYTVNVPMEAGATDGDYLMAFDRLVLPILDAYGPELLLVSAGFDSHLRDPIANMCLSIAGFDALAARLRDAAVARRCPLVFVTEGGYNLKVLGACLDGIARTLTASGSDTVGAELARPEQRGGGRPLAKQARRRSKPPHDPGDHAEPLSPDEAPLVDVPTPEATSRGALAVDLVRAAQKRYWPKL